MTSRLSARLTCISFQVTLIRSPTVGPHLRFYSFHAIRNITMHCSVRAVCILLFSIFTSFPLGCQFSNWTGIWRAFREPGQYDLCLLLADVFGQKRFLVARGQRTPIHNPTRQRAAQKCAYHLSPPTTDVQKQQKKSLHTVYSFICPADLLWGLALGGKRKRT